MSSKLFMAAAASALAVVFAAADGARAEGQQGQSSGPAVNAQLRGPQLPGGGGIRLPRIGGGKSAEGQEGPTESVGVYGGTNRPVPVFCKQSYTEMETALRGRGQRFTGESVVHSGAPGVDYELRVFAQTDQLGRLPEKGNKGAWTLVGISLSDQPDSFGGRRLMSSFPDASVAGPPRLPGMPAQEDPFSPGGDRFGSFGNDDRTEIPQYAACVLEEGMSGYPGNIDGQWWHKSYFSPR